MKESTTAYLSITCEGDSVVGTTGHLRHSLAEEVGGNKGRSQSVVVGPIAQLAITIMAPSINLSIYRADGIFFLRVVLAVNIKICFLKEMNFSTIFEQELYIFHGPTLTSKDQNNCN